MPTLITGITGFVGGHLAERLLAGGDVDLHGVNRSGQWPTHLRHIAGRVTLHAADLADPASTESLLRNVQPDQIYHLAGYAAVGESFREPQNAWTNNVSVARALLEAVVRCGRQPQILFVSSALIYGAPPRPDFPVDEHAPYEPQSPYAESKLAADRLAAEFAETHGLDLVRVRPFTHIGPRQSTRFAIASFARQLARIELGLDLPRLKTGDLSAQRDFTDVRDIVRAYALLMAQGVRGEAYNAGSGVAVSIASLLDQLRSMCPVPVEVVTQADRLRPTDAPVLVADCNKLRRATGWTPEIPLSQTLRDTLDFCRIAERDGPPEAQE
jgi:GDP-4-dehydro-6-deoxy-D-mannose reductase